MGTQEMIRNLLILSALMGAAALYTFYSDFSNAPRQSDASQTATGLQQKAPSFTFKSIDGKKHDIADYDDKVIVLNFWASWCAPCVVEFPQMVELARMTKGESIFIFLSIDEKKEDIERFLKKNKIKSADNILIGWDSDKSISRDLFQTYKLPETYILAPGMLIREKIIGADIKWDTPEMKDKIETLYKVR